MSITTVTSSTPTSGFVLTSGNELDVLSGGVATGTIVQAGGALIVASGGSETDGTIQAGGTAAIYGSASGDQVYGTETVSGVPSGIGQTEAATVFNGGAILVADYGLAAGESLDAGSLLEVETAYAELSGDIFVNGAAVIRIDAPAAPPSGRSVYGDQAVIYGFGYPPYTPSAGAVVDMPFIQSSPAVSLTAKQIFGGADDITFSVVVNGVVEQSVQFAPGHEFLAPEVGLATDSNGDVELACYGLGTQLATTRGDVAIETLRAGDLVVTASGEHRPIRWIGWRRYSGRFLANNPNAQPICLHGIAGRRPAAP